MSGPGWAAVVLGDHQARVDDEEVPVVLENQHVAAHLTQTAEGNDLQRLSGQDDLRRPLMNHQEANS